MEGKVMGFALGALTGIVIGVGAVVLIIMIVAYKEINR